MLGPADLAGPAMGDRERNKKRLLELLQATGTGNAHCADCGAAGKGATARAAGTWSRALAPQTPPHLADWVPPCAPAGSRRDPVAPSEPSPAHPDRGSPTRVPDRPLLILPTLDPVTRSRTRVSCPSCSPPPPDTLPTRNYPDVVTPNPATCHILGPRLPTHRGVPPPALGPPNRAVPLPHSGALPSSSRIHPPQFPTLQTRRCPDSDFPTYSSPARRLGAGPSLRAPLSVPWSPVTYASRCLSLAPPSLGLLPKSSSWWPPRHGRWDDQKVPCWYLSSTKVGRPRERRGSRGGQSWTLPQES